MKQFASLLARRTGFGVGNRFAFSSLTQYPFLAELGLQSDNLGAYYDGKWQTTNSTASLNSVSPATGEVIATTKCASLKDYEKSISAMQVANREWRSLPMPVRGNIVR